MSTISKEDAEKIALRIIRKNVAYSVGELGLEEAEDTDDGWIFFYNSLDYLSTGNFSSQLVGNIPVMITRDGNHRFLEWHEYERIRQKKTFDGLINLSGVMACGAKNFHMAVDEYIPMHFYVNNPFIETAEYHIRIGNLASTLFIIPVNPERMEVAEFQLFSFDKSHSPKGRRELPAITGLPMLKAQAEDFEARPDGYGLDIFRIFSVGIGDNFLEIEFSEISSANHIITSGPMDFYVHSSDGPPVRKTDSVVYYEGGAILAGIRINKLKRQQTDILRRYNRLHNEPWQNPHAFN